MKVLKEYSNGSTQGGFVRLDTTVENMIRKEEGQQEKSCCGEKKQSGRILTCAETIKK